MTHSVTVRPIRDAASDNEAIAEVEKLWGAAPGTPEGDRLDVLLALVDAYESEHHPVGRPDPIEAIKVRMVELGPSWDERGKLLGVGSGQVSEILNHRCRLTLDTIRALVAHLGLSEACLLQAYDLTFPRRVSRKAARSLQRWAAWPLEVAPEPVQLFSSRFAMLGRS